MEVALLMRTQRISRDHAELLLAQIKADGMSVSDFLHDPSVRVVDLYRSAGDLIKLAGSKERAIRAIELFRTDSES